MNSNTLGLPEANTLPASIRARQMAVRQSWSETEQQKRRAESRRLQQKLLRGLADDASFADAKRDQSTFLVSCVKSCTQAN